MSVHGSNRSGLRGHYYLDLTELMTLGCTVDRIEAIFLYTGRILIAWSFLAFFRLIGLQ